MYGTKLQYFTLLRLILLVFMVKKIKYFLVLIGYLLVTLSFVNPKVNKTGSIKTIVIDAGHGGKDPGCNGDIHKEKDVALAVALKLGKFIEQNYKEVKVIYTRTTDVFVDLEERAQIANKAKADLFISIHCNAAGKPVMIKDKKTGKKKPKTYKNKKGKIVVVEKPNPEPFGTETYVMGLKNEEGKMKVATRENSAIFLEEDYEKKYQGFDPDSPESYIVMSNYTSAYVLQSANLAVKIQEEYIKKAGRVDKGVHRQSIWVLWRTAMPSILTEIGYLTNPLEETFLGSEKGQDYLAKALFRGFRKYKDEVEGTKKKYDDEFENQEPLENENVLAGNIPGQRKASTDDDEEEDKKEVEKPKETSKEEIKNPETVITKTTSIVSISPIPKKEEPKEKINDTKFTDPITIKTDSVKTLIVKEDSVSAKSIIDKFKNDIKKQEQVQQNTNTQDVGVKDTKKPELGQQDIKKEEGIIFKVQFASSDVLLNLKQDKFKDIVEGNYYKVKTVIKYTSGNFLLITEAKAHQKILLEKGFKDCFIVALKNGERIDFAEAKKLTNQ
jgi:N-acetylmuramoyl-L-alanine amidase